MVNLEWTLGDIQDLVAGRISGRSNKDERTAFIFRGMAIGDLALASLAYEEALAAGLGQQLTR